MYLKREPYIVANKCSFEIGRTSVMRASEMKIVHPILYGSPCIQGDLDLNGDEG